MQHVSDLMVEAVVTSEDAQAVLQDAFLSFGQGTAATQARVRTQARGVKLSTLGAVIPGQDVVGAKVYTTLQGQFSFVILLFSARDGRPLATFDAGAITRLRTAACSVLAARALAGPAVDVLGLFGAGTQGMEHAVQMSRAFALREILVHDPYAPADVVARIAQQTGVAVRQAQPLEIARSANIVVTATRSSTPLFPGGELRAGTFVAAVGSSLLTSRELDDDALDRARLIVVEWREQTLSEAGDLALADPALKVGDKVVDLAEILAGHHGRRNDAEIYVYKSVGIGLEDIALAGHVYKQLAARQGWPAP